MRTGKYFSACFILIMILAGCEQANKKNPLEQQISNLQQKTEEMQKKTELLEKENQQLKEQVGVLTGIGDQKNELVYELEDVKIGRYTGFYDKDKDGKKENLIVYVKPIDTFGDVIKAAGRVDVQLWDLNNDANNALLKEWHVEPEQLKEVWFATVLTINYRLTFDVADIIEKLKNPVTVKITFTDYASGKVFRQQKAIKL